MQSNQKSLFAIGLFFIPLLVLSIIFYKERTFAFDAAYQIFDLIQTGEFAIQGTRFGAAFLQLPSLVLIRFGQPLSTIGVVYSMSAILLPAVLSLFIWRLKQNQLVYVALLFPLIFFGHSFYWAHSELLQSCYWTLLTMSLISSKIHSIFKWILISLGLSITIFLHPISPLLVIYALIFLYLQNLINLRAALCVFLLTAVLIIFRHLVFPTMTYDANIYARLDTLFDKFWLFFSYKSSKQFRSECLGSYWLYPLCILGIVQHFIRNRQYLKLTFVFLPVFALLFTVHSMFRWALPLFQMENYYMVVGWMLAFPLVFNVLPQIFKRHLKLSLWLIILLFIIRITQIKNSGDTYVDRQIHIMHVFEQYAPHHKLALEYNKTLERDWMLTWSVPYETLLLSSATGPSKSLYVFNDEIIPLQEEFAGLKQRIPSEQLNPTYFDLPVEKYFLISAYKK